MFAVTHLAGFGGQSLRLFRFTATNESDVVLTSKLTAAGWDGKSPVEVEFTVPSGVVVGSTSINGYGLDTGILPSGSVVWITNNGYIVGKGGNGGNANSGPGEKGGTAMRVRVKINLRNSGTIGGGGGGGGGGANESPGGETYDDPGGGGGGGAGSVSGSGGGGARGGAAGTLTTGGAGGQNMSGDGGWGGFAASGGNLGQPGGTKYGQGGAAGVAIEGYSLCRVLSQGTVLGATTG